MSTQRRQYVYVVLDVSCRASDSVVELGLITATGNEAAMAAVRRNFIRASAGDVTGATFDERCHVEVSPV